MRLTQRELGQPLGRGEQHRWAGVLCDELRERAGEAPDSRAVFILRRLRRALSGGETGGDGTRRRPPVSGPSRRSRGWEE